MSKQQASAAHLEDTSSVADVRHVVRKIDFYLMPLLIVTFMLQYVDKTILNGAAQFGIIQDLHLYTVDGYTKTPEPQPILNLNRFSICTLIFYWGCLVGLVPASWLAQRWPIGIYLASSVMMWGVIVMLTVFVSSYHGFLVQRFFLGVTECVVAPGISLIITMWWKRDEQPLRYSLWYTSTGLGALLGSLLIFGIGHIHGSLDPWKYQYLILGGITVAWGALLMWLLPQNPASARFLSPEERLIAVERKRIEQTGIEDKHFKWYQLRELALDPVTWLFIPTTFCLHFANGGVSGFGSVIVNSLGYTPLQSILLTGAVGVGVFVTCLIAGTAGTVLKDSRTWLVVACQLCVVLGASLTWKLNWHTQRAGAIVGFVLCGCFSGSYMMILALAGANVAGHTKKTFMSCVIWCCWGISNGVAPLTVKKPQIEQHYPTCFLAMIVTASVTIVGALALRAWYAFENRKRQAQFGQVDHDAALEVGFDDKTDRENKYFRYSL